MARSSRRPIATSACKHSPRRGALGVSSRIFGPGILHQPLTKQITQPGCPRSGFSDRGSSINPDEADSKTGCPRCFVPDFQTWDFTTASACRHSPCAYPFVHPPASRQGNPLSDCVPLPPDPAQCYQRRNIQMDATCSQPANRTSVTPPSRAFVRKSVENFRPFPRFQHAHSSQSIRPERGKKHIPPPCFG